MISKIISQNPAILRDEIQRLKECSEETNRDLISLRSLSAKNLNSYPYNETTKTASDVTFTDMGDGTIKVNGTASAGASFACHKRSVDSVNQLIVPNGKYRISGCPEGGSVSTYRITCAITKGGGAVTLGRDSGLGQIIEINGDDSFTDRARLQIAIDISKSVAMDNAIFKPMLELVELADPEAWQSWSMTNNELTAKVGALECKETTAGSYQLVATVDSEGAVTYDWEVID